METSRAVSPSRKLCPALGAVHVPIRREKIETYSTMYVNSQRPHVLVLEGRHAPAPGDSQGGPAAGVCQRSSGRGRSARSYPHDRRVQGHRCAMLVRVYLPVGFVRRGWLGCVMAAPKISVTRAGVERTSKGRGTDLRLPKPAAEQHRNIPRDPSSALLQPKAWEKGQRKRLLLNTT